jgi:CheY-like chemotaxis protein
VLPRRAVTRPVMAQPQMTTPRPGAAAVLVVEDDRRDQEVLVAALTGAGYSVEVAATGSQAVARCRERRFEAITLDLLLPDMSGLEVMQQIRSDTGNRDVPIIVITVVAERGSVAGFAVSDVLPKPLDAGSLLGALSRAGVTPTRSGAVLVVDDDPGSLKLMSTTLAQLGYQTCCASDGESALRSAEGTPPSAVVLDLMMPGMNGFEFLARLRSQPSGQRVPVIVWTVKDLDHEEHALLRSSAQAVVAKGQGGPAAVVAELAAFLRAGEA